MFDTMKVVIRVKIKKIKKLGSKYKITLDNGEVLYTFDDVILKNNLLYTKEISSDLLHKLERDTEYYDVYNKVVNMIARRLRSEREIYDYLKKLNVDEEEAEEIVYTLKMIKLIDDYNFAKAYTHDRISLSLDGPYKISRYLEEQGVDSDIVNEMIRSYPKDLIDERIERIVKKRIKTNKMYTGHALKQRIKVYLVRLGYSREDIEKHLYLVEYDTALLEREMERFYKKYSLKYEGEELYLFLKSKLLSRGFRNSDVDNYLKKKQF